MFAGCIPFVEWLSSFFGGKLNWNILTKDGQTVLEVAEEAKKGDMVVLVLEQIDAWENASWDKLVHTSANKEEMLAIQSLDSLMMLTAAEKRRLWSSRDTFLDMSLLGKFIQVRMRHESRVCTPLNCF